jgi:hypothetical protein
VLRVSASSGAHGLRDQPHQRRHEDGRGRAVDEREHREHPHLGAAREQQRGGDALRQRAHDVGSDHDPAPPDAVGPHAAGQREEREGDPAGRQDEAEVAGRPQPEDGEGDGDRRDAVAHDRQRLAPEEEPERWVFPQ